MGDVKTLETKLSQAKTKQEKNVAEIENSVDEITEQTEREFKELFDNLQKLKNKHLDEVASALKKGRDKLNGCTNVLTDGIQCANYCSRDIEKAKETENDDELLMMYYRVKARLMQLKRFKFMEKTISISGTKSQVLKELGNMESFRNLAYSESDRHVMYDVNNITLSLVTELDVGEGNSKTYAGNFLSNGSFAVTKHSRNGQCFIYNKHLKSTKVIEGLDNPFEVIQSGEELLVTCNGSRSLEVVSAFDFHKVKSINFNNEVLGMAKCNGAWYVACRNKIIKIDTSGKIQREYQTEGNNINISSTKDGHLVYTNYGSHTVTVITDKGDRMWQYTHHRMEKPYGLDVDSVGNIFSAATQSNNIHVLSRAGGLIRIIEDIPRPVFIKLMEKRGVCCVCSDYKLMNVYKLFQ
jgi:hypothetical protein